MRSCDQAKITKTYNRALDRAKVLGYQTLEDCVAQRISSGTTVRDLAGKLDVSEHYLEKWMKKLDVQSCHRKKVPFWGREKT